MTVTDKGQIMDIISITFPIAEHDFQCKGHSDAVEPHVIKKGRVHTKFVYRMRGDRKNKAQENHRYCPDCWVVITSGA